MSSLEPGLDTIITPETYIDAIGIDVPEGTLLRPEERDGLYGLIIEFANEHGSAEPLEGPLDITGLELRLLRTAVHIRLGRNSADDLKTFAEFAAWILGMTVNPAALSVGALVSLQTRISHADPSVGQLSVVDAMFEIRRGTAEEIVVRLHGKTCRHLGNGCRYLNGTLCGLRSDAAAKIIDDLVAKGMFRQLTSAAPAEYEVAF